MSLYNTLQQVFDGIWRHFVTLKNPQSIVNKDSALQPFECLYSGSGCAIGCLIPDKDVCKDWDIVSGNGTGIKEIFYLKPESYDLFFTTNLLTHLSELQNIHDIYTGDKESFTSYMEVELTKFAQENNLTLPVEAITTL